MNLASTIEKEEKQQLSFEQNVQRGKKQGILELDITESKERIIYKAKETKNYNYKDPEEKVRASLFAELVLDYGYSANNIELEVTMPARVPNNLADIVVYDENNHPFLVVECKKDNVTDSEFKQAIEQAFGNANSLDAKFLAVIAGNTRQVFDRKNYSPTEREKNVIADIPVKYGKPPKYKYIKGSLEPKEVSRQELIKALEKCHDTVWQGGKLDPTNAFDAVSKLLFCKLKDEKDTKYKDAIYQFQIGTNETRKDVAKRIIDMYSKAKNQDPDVFKGEISLDADIIYQVVEHIQGINFNQTDLDSKGVAFERFLGDFFKGKMGQFFTPRDVIEFTVKMLFEDNNLKVLKTPQDFRVFDPTCGSGGFLLYALDSVRKFAEYNLEGQDAWSHWHDFAEKRLFGIEINDQIARVCKMNMIIHDDGHTNVIGHNSLDSFDNITKHKADFQKDHFDIILTNPPFGATVKASEDKEILESFELGKGRKTQKTEILFIERCIDFVKPETGRIGMVLPDGILTNSSLQYVRDFIMERCQIEAVVSLPQFAFSHYGAGVKSSVLFLRRLGKGEQPTDYPIFMAIAENIGYDATGRRTDSNDLHEILKQFHEFRKNPANFQ